MSELNPQLPPEALLFQSRSIHETAAVFDPYRNSTLVDKLQGNEDPTLICLDLDGTMDQDPAAAERVVARYQTQGTVIIHVTSRTEEMCMSRADYQKSLPYGFDRPAPKMYRDPETGKLVERFGDEPGAYDKYAGQYSPDVIVAQTGGRVYIHQRDGGYALDTEHEESLGVAVATWRTGVIDILQAINTDGTLFTITGPEDDQAKYLAGQRDVAALELRHTVRFDESKAELDTTGATSTMGDMSVAQFNYQRMLQFVATFKDYQHTLGNDSYRTDLDQLKQKLLPMDDYGMLRRLVKEGGLKKQVYAEIMQYRITSFDDAVLELQKQHGIDRKKLLFAQNICVTSDSNPDNFRYQVYLTPRRATKQRGLHYLIQRISEIDGIDFIRPRMVYAGDSYPDLKAGSYAAGNADVTQVWVADSRMTKVLTDPNEKVFGNVSLRAIKNRLSNNGEGQWEFRTPLFGQRDVIIGAAAAPGTKGPQTLEKLQERGII